MAPDNKNKRPPASTTPHRRSHTKKQNPGPSPAKAASKSAKTKTNTGRQAAIPEFLVPTSKHRRSKKDKQTSPAAMVTATEETYPSADNPVPAPAAATSPSSVSARNNPPVPPSAPPNTAPITNVSRMTGHGQCDEETRFAATFAKGKFHGPPRQGKLVLR